MSDLILRRVLEHARQRPDALAVVAGDEEISWSVLVERVGAAAGQFSDRGVRAGDRVILAAEPGAAFVAAYLAAHSIGAVVVPVDPKVTAATLDDLTTRVEPAGVWLTIEADDYASLESLVGGGSRELPDLPEPDPDAPADLLFTSGTTGEPKGVLLSQRAIAAAAAGINEFLGTGPDDREVVPLPLSHSFGLGRMRCNLLAGGTLILVDGFVAPAKIVAALERFGATGFACVPAGFAVLFRMTGDRLGDFAGALRYIEIGSAPMPREHKQKLIELLPQTRIAMHYGLTEASRAAFIEFHRDSGRLDSVGRPSPHVEIRVTGDDGAECAPGASGRLMMRGDAVLTSYWRDPQRTADAFQGEWFDSGDYGHRDDDGYLYLEARHKDLINVGGRKVSPVEIERLLEAHPAVAACGCTGIPDPQGLTGMAVKAFLVQEQGAERPANAALAKQLRGRIEAWKMPKAFEWVDTLPRTAAGKLQRHLLSSGRHKT